MGSLSNLQRLFFALHTAGEVEKTAYIDKSVGLGEWHSVEENSASEQAVIICQIKGKQIN